MSKLDVWAEGMNRQRSCNTVTVACAVSTNSLCRVDEWYHHDCVTRSNMLSTTQDAPADHCVRQIQKDDRDRKEPSGQIRQREDFNEQNI